MTAAIQADLVPVSLQALYHQNITRAEFCALAVATLEAVKGKDIDAVVLETKGATLDSYLHLYPFTDTASRSILACYALGIVNGRGDGTFDPYASISRQEAAVMLRGLGKVLGVTSGEAVAFTDAAAFPSWAVDAIKAVSGMIDPTTGKAVMGGTGNGAFSPTQSYTREQSCITMGRLFNAASTISTDPDGDQTGWTPPGWSWKAGGPESCGLAHFTSGKYVRADGKAVLYIDSSAGAGAFQYWMYVIPKGPHQDAYMVPGELDPDNKGDAEVLAEGSAIDHYSRISFQDAGDHTIEVTETWIEEMYFIYPGPAGTYILSQEKKP